MLTSEPFLKDLTAERTLTQTQRRATAAVIKLKHLQTIRSGSGPGRTLAFVRVGGRREEEAVAGSAAVAIGGEVELGLGFENWDWGIFREEMDGVERGGGKASSSLLSV